MATHAYILASIAIVLFSSREQMMTTQAGHSPSDTELLETSQPSLGARFGAFKTHVAAWIATCVAYYEAAALYEQLSRLSNAELHRHGLSRDTLARDVCDAYERRKDTESREG
jgi:hypothetical protein